MVAFKDDNIYNKFREVFGEEGMSINFGCLNNASDKVVTISGTKFFLSVEWMKISVHCAQHSLMSPQKLIFSGSKCCMKITCKFIKL